MKADWIIDVLADMREFALANDLPRFAADLDRAQLTAEAELATRPPPPEQSQHQRA